MVALITTPAERREHRVSRAIESAEKAAESLANTFTKTSRDLGIGKGSESAVRFAVLYPHLCINGERTLYHQSMALLKFSEVSGPSQAEKAEKLLLEMYYTYVQEASETEQKFRKSPDYYALMETAKDHFVHWNFIDNSLRTLTLGEDYDALQYEFMKSLKRE